MSDSESEAAETQVWLQFSVECNYMNRDTAKTLYSEYDEIIAMLVHMINHANDWTIK
ncbi:MAG: four helix bundle protein [Pirellulaceae bacterium]|nr:four helix bundle protein [Pirellulaceae bacterium]HJN10221.1 four helix bundle protein [Pirellulaceae bacterium]